jgi:hypothetical protein
MPEDEARRVTSERGNSTMQNEGPAAIVCEFGVLRRAAYPLALCVAGIGVWWLWDANGGYFNLVLACALLLYAISNCWMLVMEVRGPRELRLSKGEVIVVWRDKTEDVVVPEDIQILRSRRWWDHLFLRRSLQLRYGQTTTRVFNGIGGCVNLEHNLLGLGARRAGG